MLKSSKIIILAVFSLFFCSEFAMGNSFQSKILLAEDWKVQSSSLVKEKGEVISTANYQPTGWYLAHLPATVLAVLVKNKVYPDPYFGMNLHKIPGNWPVGLDISMLPMPPFSPFRNSWWYWKEFEIPKNWKGKKIWLHFNGINFRADIWLNGKKIANSSQVAGTYRLFEFEVSKWINFEGKNVLAVEVFPPKHHDLALTWVDWNPSPPDRNMGIWKEVYLSASGPVAIRHPYVITELELPSLKKAHLTVIAELINASDKEINGILYGEIGKITFSQKISLKAEERKEIAFTPEKYPQLNIFNPKLWWPYELGKPYLYSLKLWFKYGGKISDQTSIRFGIRKIESELTPEGYRLFKVNGKKILVKGAGWAPDMLLRFNPERLKAQILYVKNMHLNTIRLEGKLESDLFYDLCDEQGILVIAGWCCCHQWEWWNKWDDEDYIVAKASMTDQIKRLRSHPCILSFWYGSDNPPPPDVEKMYIEVLKKCRWQNPYQSSATSKPTVLTGKTGLKMTGPYEYVPPVYWYEDKKRGGAFGFNTETSPGPAPPVIESLKMFLPPEHLWPPDQYWNYHCGRGMFGNLKVFNKALEKRYGPAKDLEDYERKAQAMTYEAQRAMFEAYRRNKFTSTGVIQWMLNDAWTSMIWHLYDYYLRPVGGFYGTQKACEPVHILYAYDDHSAWIANALEKSFSNLTAKVEIYNFDMNKKFSSSKTVNLAPNSIVKVVKIPQIDNLSETYFISLHLKDGKGNIISRNFYWLSKREDKLRWPLSQWYYTPISQYADLKMLQNLAPAQIKAKGELKIKNQWAEVKIALENISPNLAFMLRLSLYNRQNQKEILPVFWKENYISLLPGEKRNISARFWQKELKNSSLLLKIKGWNVKEKNYVISLR